MNDRNKDRPDPFIIVDEDTGEQFYGGRQAWFERHTMTFAGCGVVAAANAMRVLLCMNPKLYESAKGKLSILGNVIVTKAEYTDVINDMYRHMFVMEIPGINLLYDKGNYPYGSKMFKFLAPSYGMTAASVIRGLLRYAKNNGILLHHRYLSAAYVDYDRGLAFIKEGLKQSGAVILMTCYNRHPITLHQGKTVSQSSMKTHFATITGVTEENGEPVIRLSTWGKLATVPYRTLHESWQKRRAYASALFCFLPETSKALYRADIRRSVSYTPVAALQTALGRRMM
ncbi:MAG: hypothetical protein K6G83_07710 [Lachnospiraceae bacterium]|nr:hypothetical protein [Lachnospiraceae bacterium]